MAKGVQDVSDEQDSMSIQGRLQLRTNEEES